MPENSIPASNEATTAQIEQIQQNIQYWKQQKSNVLRKLYPIEEQTNDVLYLNGEVYFTLSKLSPDEILRLQQTVSTNEAKEALETPLQHKIININAYSPNETYRKISFHGTDQKKIDKFLRRDVDNIPFTWNLIGNKFDRLTIIQLDSTFLPYLRKLKFFDTKISALQSQLIGLLPNQASNPIKQNFETKIQNGNFGSPLNRNTTDLTTKASESSTAPDSPTQVIQDGDASILGKRRTRDEANNDNENTACSPTPHSYTGELNSSYKTSSSQTKNTRTLALTPNKSVLTSNIGLYTAPSSSSSANNMSNTAGSEASSIQGQHFNLADENTPPASNSPFSHTAASGAAALTPENSKVVVQNTNFFSPPTAGLAENNTSPVSATPVNLIHEF